MHVGSLYVFNVDTDLYRACFGSLVGAYFRISSEGSFSWIHRWSRTVEHPFFFFNGPMSFEKMDITLLIIIFWFWCILVCFVFYRKKKKVVKKWACLKSNPRQRSESGSPNNWAIPLFKQKLYRYEYTVDLNWTWLFCILKHSPLWPLPSSPFHHLLFFNAWGVGPSPLCGWVDSLLRRRAKNLLKFQNLHLLFVHPFC